MTTMTTTTNNTITTTEGVVFVLMEIVSGRNLQHRSSLFDREVDPYCIVRLRTTDCNNNNNNNDNDKIVHRTDTIYNDDNPIWTIHTKSLCLLEVPTPSTTTVETSQDDDDDDNTNNDDIDTVVVIADVIVEVWHGTTCLGVVTVSLSQVLSNTNRQGQRIEYPIVPKRSTDNNDNNNNGTLALRFRKATQDDLIFFDKQQQNVLLSSSSSSLPDRNCNRYRTIRSVPTTTTTTTTRTVATATSEAASDINLVHVQGKKNPFMTQYVKVDENIIKYRVQPYPDGDSLETTTWMTRDEIYNEAIKPSKKWIEAGTGRCGRVFVEVFGCNDLPNMDVGVVGVVKDYTDPFVGIVVEDTMVRTDVIHDTLNPRWMPWCTRAFCFHFHHPSSLIMVGVFDYDAATDHDPIGRIVISNMTNFKDNTSYVLTYALHNDPLQTDDVGTIQIRLRVEWNDEYESEAKKLAFTIPPRFHINVQNQRAFACLRYLCRGKINMEKASVESVKFYANELMSYGLVYCYLIDVMLGILLWRGRAKLWVVGKSIWFPIHSIALLTAAVVAIETPTMIPAVVFFGVAYILLAINYYGSTYPYPWNRCKSFHETNKVLLFGRSVHPPVYIEPFTGVDEAEALENLDRVKAERVSKFLWDAKTVGLKVRRVYAKTSMTKIAIDTAEQEGWFAGSLYYVHMALMYFCTYLRLFRNFVNWKGYFTHKLTLYCLFLGFAWVFLPMNTITLWVARLVVWTCLGPWMKLVDVFYIHAYYQTKEELLAAQQSDDEGNAASSSTFLERSILQSSTLQSMGTSARLASEEALKLKHFREAQFGTLSQLVPSVDTCRHTSIPLADSTAQPYCGRSSNDNNQEVNGFVDLPLEQQHWERASSQLLEGTMLPTPRKVTERDVLFEM